MKEVFKVGSLYKRRITFYSYDKWKNRPFLILKIKAKWSGEDIMALTEDGTIQLVFLSRDAYEEI